MGNVGHYEKSSKLWNIDTQEGEENNRWHRLDLQQDHSRKLPKQGKTHPYRHKMHAEHQIEKTRKENPYHS